MSPHSHRRVTARLRSIALLTPVAVALALGVATTIRAGAVTSEVVFLEWPDYIDPDVAAEYPQDPGGKLRQVYYASDSDRDGMLALAGPGDYDVVVMDGGHLDFYRKRGWLAPITEDHIPNLTHIDQKWLDAYPASRGYAVPYFWGTTGIAYRSDLVAEPISSLMQLFRPDPELCGRIMMPGDVRELTGLALRALGYSINSTNAEELDQAHALLTEQKSCVLNYDVPDVDENSEVLTGEALAAVTYNGDALFLAGFNEDLVYVVPDEGATLWVDYLVVLENSTRKKAAYAFIDHLNRPDIAIRQAEYLYFATPNLAAEAGLPVEFLQDATIYPTQPVLERSEFEGPVPPVVLRHYNAIYTDIVDGGGA